MRNEQAGVAFEFTMSGFPTGLVGTVGVTILDKNEAVVTARDTTGFAESQINGVGTGIYSKQITIANPGEYKVIGDKGLPVTPSGVAIEDVEITVGAPVFAGPTGSDLCTLADVRQQMELTTAATELDPIISTLITLASRSIMLEVDREFAPASTGVTRTFPIHGRLVDLVPFELRAATTVTLDPNGTPKVLVANSDYHIEPTGGDDFGVYTELLLSSYLTILPQTAFRFGIAEIGIQGNWGFPTVPEPARQACIVTVRSWLRRDSAHGAYVDPDMGAIAPDPGSYYGLPPAARRLLDVMRRTGSVI